MKSTAVNKKRAEGIKEKIDILKDFELKYPAEEEVSLEPVLAEPEVPFGGGELVGLIINPTPKEVQAEQGYDEYGLSHSRSYGCSLFLPLVHHCSKLTESGDAVDRMVGFKHLGDRFMVKRPTGAKFSLAEEAIYVEAQKVGQNLLDRGALYPLSFPSISVMGHTGHEPLAGHWVPSCGFANTEILPAFTDYMEDLSRWLQKTRIEMTALVPQIEAGLVAPTTGYYTA